MARDSGTAQPALHGCNRRYLAVVLAFSDSTGILLQQRLKVGPDALTLLSRLRSNICRRFSVLRDREG
jgi:hypothetical protein